MFMAERGYLLRLEVVDMAFFEGDKGVKDRFSLVVVLEVGVFVLLVI